MKGYVRWQHGDRPAPTCFVSYAWGDPAHERWVDEVLVEDMRKAELDVLFDRSDNAAPGSNIARFVERLDDVDWAMVVGTPAYLAKHRNDSSPHGYVVAAEMDLIHQRMTGSERDKRTVVPVLREGEPDTALPPLLRGLVHVDLRDDDSYLPAMFDLILTLHGIDHRDDAVADLRQRIRLQLGGPA